VGVFDKNSGVPVTSLSKDNFSLQSNHSVLKLASVTLRQEPPRTLLAIEGSRSMRDPSKSSTVAALALGIIEAAAPNSPLALVFFSDKIRERYDFATSKDVLVRRIVAFGKGDPASTWPQSATAFRDSLAEATELFGQARAADTIFLISDGADGRSNTSPSRLKAILLEHGLRLFVLEPHPYDFKTREERYGEYDLHELSSATGGLLTVFGKTLVPGIFDASDKALAFAENLGKSLYAGSAIRYQLGIELEQALSKREKLTVRITPPYGGERHDLEVRYPSYLLPCSVPLAK
jgi:hypothetical protein